MTNSPPEPSQAEHDTDPNLDVRLAGHRPWRHADEPVPKAVRRYLLPTEACVFAVRLHPMKMWVPMLVTYLAFVFTTAAWLLASPDSPWLAIAVFASIISAVWLTFRLIDWYVERLILTDHRMLLMNGVLTRRVGMMPLVKVTDMTFERSILGRLTGYGTFVLESAGQEQALHRINYVPDPDELYQEVADLLFGEGSVLRK